MQTVVGTIWTVGGPARILTTPTSDTTYSIFMKLRMHEQIVTSSQHLKWGCSTMSGSFFAEYRQVAQCSTDFNQPVCFLDFSISHSHAHSQSHAPGQGLCGIDRLLMQECAFVGLIGKKTRSWQLETRNSMKRTPRQFPGHRKYAV